MRWKELSKKSFFHTKKKKKKEKFLGKVGVS